MRDAPPLDEWKRFPAVTDQQVAEAKKREQAFNAWNLKWHGNPKSLDQELHDAIERDITYAVRAFYGYLDARDESKSVYERRLGLKLMRDSLTHREWTGGKLRPIVAVPES
jgi:hypothetical protein